MNGEVKIEGFSEDSIQKCGANFLEVIRDVKKC